MGVCTKERKGVTAAALMATPCTNSLGGESGGQKHEGCGGRGERMWGSIRLHFWRPFFPCLDSVGGFPTQQLYG